MPTAHAAPFLSWIYYELKGINKERFQARLEFTEKDQESRWRKEGKI